MTLEKLLNKINKAKNKLRTASRIAATGLILTASNLGITQMARADESNYLSADFNKDGIVDVRDMEAFGEAWLEAEGQTTGIPVYGCGCLDEANATYVLMNDVEAEGNCFTLLDEVTFDMNNHTIRGDETGFGVSVNSGSIIRNGTIDNFEVGFRVFGDNNNISSIASNNNNYDGFLIFGDQNKLSLFSTKFEYGQAIHIIGKNNQIKNSDFSCNGWGHIESDSSSNIFIDCKYDSESGSLTRAYSYNPLVQDASGTSIANAKVYGNRADGELEFMLRTGADGKVSLPLIDYINQGGEKEEFAPYTITAEKDSLSKSHVYDPNGFNSEDSFVLANE